VNVISNYKSKFRYHNQIDCLIRIYPIHIAFHQKVRSIAGRTQDHSVIINICRLCCDISPIPVRLNNISVNREKRDSPLFNQCSGGWQSFWHLIP
jgi:hypothetical protein